MTTAPQQRQRTGTVPLNTDGMIYDGANVDREDCVFQDWRVYRLTTGLLPWIDLKVVRMEPAKGPANHFLSWHWYERRFASGEHADRVAPAVLDAVRDIMEVLYTWPTGDTSRKDFYADCRLTEADMTNALAEARAFDALDAGRRADAVARYTADRDERIRVWRAARGLDIFS